MSHNASHRQTPSSHPTHHHHSPSLTGTTLQIPSLAHPINQSATSAPTPTNPNRPKSPSATRHPPDQSSRTSDPSKPRASTRQSDSTSSNWSSASGATSTKPPPAARSPLQPYFYPTSGYPVSKNVLQQTYPGSGYPVSDLTHSYGYPSNNFPCCEIPGVADLRSQLFYPSSEFPGAGGFPGEIAQDDGSAPFISGLETENDPELDPAVPYVRGGVGFLPGGGGGGEGTPAGGGVYLPGSFAPTYSAEYPL